MAEKDQIDGEKDKRPSVDLKVAEAKNRDVIRGKIRLDNHSMRTIGVSTGEIVEITGTKTTAAVAWPAYPEDLKKSIIRMDSVIRQNAGVSLSERVVIKKASPSKAKRLVFASLQNNISFEFGFESFVKRKLLGYPVTLNDTVMIPVLGRANPFVVVELEPEAITIITDDTLLEITDKSISDSQLNQFIVSYEDIGGLDEPIQKLREMVELPLSHPILFEKLGIEPPKGVLLHGAPGTGKTLIARAIVQETKAHFITINGPEIMSKYYGESEQRIRSIFREAEEKSPTIIFIDEIDAIAPKREDTAGEVERRVVAQLLASMDGMNTRGQVVVIAATNREGSIDAALRRPGRFDREIEIGVPNIEGRLAIMQIHTRSMPLAENVNLKHFAEITHGLVGADIKAFSREAAMRTLRRFLPDIDLEADSIPVDILNKMEITKSDFEEAQKEIEPSALREVYVEVPNVTYNDIGGLEDLIEELKETVEWPLKKPQVFTNMGITPPAGILLYGPPGTGKTLLAKAVANESEANFISIKGPEILSKWVGESEKAIRETFRKARMAAPTVIFFDEIDSIAPKRGSNSDTSVTGRVISQLLTEIEGLEKLENVIVLAGTNRPDILDPALLRPGRFDRLLYVRPPSLEGRKQILKIYTNKMPLEKNLDINTIAKQLDGFVGADIEALCREAGLNALRENFEIEEISLKHFINAKEKVHATMTPDAYSYYDKIELSLKAQHVKKIDKEKKEDYL